MAEEIKPKTRPLNNNHVKRPRILWANVYCLTDTSSGASLAAREILRQLSLKDCEVSVLGATVFDTPNGLSLIKDNWDFIKGFTGQFVDIQDAPLVHHVLVTKSTMRDDMSSREETLWFHKYMAILDEFKPDIVMYYGGQAFDFLIANEARKRKIPVVFYLANPNYSSHRWCQDVDLILTDSRATADMYRDREGYDVTPIGAFINRPPVVASHHSRERILLINPSIEKGASIFIQLALLIGKRRPEIQFEVVESRGNWNGLVKDVTASLGEPRETLPNVVVTQNTGDMRPIYGRAKILLVPSLCWESSGRVVVEAMMNGIPPFVSNRGGLPEMIGDGGITVDFPPECYEPPFDKVPQLENLEALVAMILRMYDDNAFYEAHVVRAHRAATLLHDVETNVQRLMTALAPLIKRRARDQAHGINKQTSAA